MAKGDKKATNIVGKFSENVINSPVLPGAPAPQGEAPSPLKKRAPRKPRAVATVAESAPTLTISEVAPAKERKPRKKAVLTPEQQAKRNENLAKGREKSAITRAKNKALKAKAERQAKKDEKYAERFSSSARFRKVETIKDDMKNELKGLSADGKLYVADKKREALMDVLPHIQEAKEALKEVRDDAKKYVADKVREARQAVKREVGSEKRVDRAYIKGIRKHKEAMFEELENSDSDM